MNSHDATTVFTALIAAMVGYQSILLYTMSSRIENLEDKVSELMLTLIQHTKV